MWDVVNMCFNFVNTNVHDYIFSHVNVHVIIFLTYVLIINACVVMFNLYYLLPTNSFGLYQLTENNKEESLSQVQLVFFCILV